MEKTRVRFVTFRGETVALFPDARERDGILSYAHVGQHGSASPSLMRCKRAPAEEVRELTRELESLGYRLTLV